MVSTGYRVRALRAALSGLKVPLRLAGGTGGLAPAARADGPPDATGGRGRRGRGPRSPRSDAGGRGRGGRPGRALLQTALTPREGGGVRPVRRTGDAVGAPGGRARGARRSEGASAGATRAGGARPRSAGRVGPRP